MRITRYRRRKGDSCCGCCCCCCCDADIGWALRCRYSTHDPFTRPPPPTDCRSQNRSVMERIQSTRFSFRRKGSKNKDREARERDATVDFDYETLSYLRSAFAAVNDRTATIVTSLSLLLRQIFSARCNSSRDYATMSRLSMSVRLSVTEVHWRIIANLGFKFRSKFTAHCGRGEG